MKQQGRSFSWSLKIHCNLLLSHPDKTSAITGGSNGWRGKDGMCGEAEMSPRQAWPCFIVTSRVREALGPMWTQVAKGGSQVETACKLSLQDGLEIALSKKRTAFAMSAVFFLPWLGAGGRGPSLNVLTRLMLKSNLHCYC